jgi:hypothetical protein
MAKVRGASVDCGARWACRAVVVFRRQLVERWALEGQEEHAEMKANRDAEV